MSTTYLPFFPQGHGGEPCQIVSGICATLAFIAVGLRFYTKWRYVGRIKMDDWLMLSALVFLLAYCSAVIVASVAITQTPTHSISGKDYAISIDMLNSAEIFYVTAVGMLKLSIARFFLEILTSGPLRLVVYYTVGPTTLFGVGMILFCLFQCGLPTDALSFIDKRFLHPELCVSDSAALGMTYTHAVLTIFTDWTFLIMPFFVLRGTLMQKREKYTLAGILAFASISGIAAIARLPYIRLLAAPKYEIFASVKNIAIFSAIEPAVGVIAGSLVTMRPLFRIMFSNTSSRKRGGYADIETPRLATFRDPEDHFNDPIFDKHYDVIPQHRPSTDPPEYARFWEKMSPKKFRAPMTLGVLPSPTDTVTDNSPPQTQILASRLKTPAISRPQTSVTRPQTGGLRPKTAASRPHTAATFYIEATTNDSGDISASDSIGAAPSDWAAYVQLQKNASTSTWDTPPMPPDAIAQRSSWLSRIDMGPSAIPASQRGSRNDLDPSSTRASERRSIRSSRRSLFRQTIYDRPLPPLPPIPQNVFPAPRKSYVEPGLPLHLFGGADEREVSTDDSSSIQ
ncbi:hypothetical protein BT63DRAFT_415384 [Microthyrium microscopicum]|uniref:Rhodopsin domain-containing protein n=1 Tax=Microthyrium microscopicum TaxID=703497 RepID=A0A6A6UAD4_9PEZI|nr:hypothetical protein BT63DRAFT_415384 [Microthyrium microscopicum]